MLLAVFCQCKDIKNKEPVVEETTSETSSPILEEGSFEARKDAFWDLVPRDARLEILAEGHDWTEGPLWVEAENMLLYTDIPRNAVYGWKEGRGASVYLKPSGYMGEDFEGEEPGANGLILDQQGSLVLCQHGERRIARMLAPLDAPMPEYEALATTYEGKRFNSPNDATYKSNGDLYFTDPPYGLPKQVDDPAKELPFQGVYRLSADGKVSLLTNSLSRPNGIAFSPDERVLYVANSDPEKAIWMTYDLTDDGQIGNGRILYDATDQVPDHLGLPDGMKVHSSGTLFATGPGGLFLFSPEGDLLGRIYTGQATANCAFNEDESYLYITADSYLLRLKMK